MHAEDCGMNHLFVLREQRHLDALVTNLNNNWRAFAQMDKPLGCTVAPYRMNRSQEQNGLMWVWLTQTAAQAWVQGQRFSAETWNEHFKRELLPERNAKGLAKWEVLPSGERTLAMSTKDLNVAEMGLYMQALQAALATDLGVQTS
jgi:hypothetical protein